MILGTSMKLNDATPGSWVIHQADSKIYIGYVVKFEEVNCILSFENHNISFVRYPLEVVMVIYGCKIEIDLKDIIPSEGLGSCGILLSGEGSLFYAERRNGNPLFVRIDDGVQIKYPRERYMVAKSWKLVQTNGATDEIIFEFSTD